MNFKHLALGLALLVPSLAYSTDASAGDEYLKCENKKDDKSKAKCNKTYGKWLTKQKSSTTPIMPSMLNDKLASLDEEGKNPFATDDWYMGSSDTGLESVDALLNEVNKVMGTVKMAKYVGHLHKTGDKDQATELASIILPDLINLKDIVPTLQEKLAAVQADLPNLAKENPKAALSAGKPIAATVKNIAKLPGDLAGALKAITPLAKGSVDAAKDMAADKVKDAAGGK